MPRPMYIYGITDHGVPKSLGRVGLGSPPRQVYALIVRQLAVLVSETDGQSLIVTPEDVLAHEGVLETAMADRTVLPFRFGTVAGSREEVLALVKENYAGFAAGLRDLRGKAEFVFKAYWRKEGVRRAVESRVGSFAELRRKMAQQADKERQFSITVGQATEEVIEHLKEECDTILAHLERECVRMKVNPPAGIYMLANASFLVKREGEEQFRRRVSSLTQPYDDKLRVTCAGPLPAYDFVPAAAELGGNQDA